MPAINNFDIEQYKDFPILMKGLEWQQSYNQQLYQDQQFLLNLNYGLSQQYNVAQLKVLHQQTLDNIEKDLTLIKALNKELRNHSASDQVGEETLTWSLKTNKMEAVLSGAKTLLMEPEHFLKLAHGKYPQYLEPEQIEPRFPVKLGLENLYGSDNLTNLNAAIVEINLTLRGPSAKLQDIQSDDQLWIDKSALAHVTPIPDFIKDLDNFKDCSFYFSDDITPNGLAFIHSGYAFGGQRAEARYGMDSEASLSGKLHGPEDCSSWLAKLIDLPDYFSTIDQLFTYRLLTDSQAYIDQDWISSTTGKMMTEHFTPAIVEKVSDIRPGQIMTIRQFAEDENHNQSAGNGGHTVIVINADENKVLALSLARDIPYIEGLGVREFDWHATPTQEIFFMDVVAKSLESELALC